VTTPSPVRRRSGLALFWAVTFSTTLACWLTAIAIGGEPTSFPTAIPYLLGGFGPVYGAIAVRILRARRRAGTGRLLSALPFLVLAVATVVGAALLAAALGGPAVDLTEGRDLVVTAGGPVPFLISMLIAGPIAEEPGWRGAAYPRLRATMNRLQAGLVLGAAWAVWHLPLFFITGTVQNELGLFSWSGLLFTLSVFPMALLTGYAYEVAGVVASIAVHFGVNTTMALLTVKSPATQAAVLVVQIMVAAVLLASWRGRPATDLPAHAGHPDRALDGVR
jgi:membrane protease YdiL (CAAX protease family)